MNAHQDKPTPPTAQARGHDALRALDLAVAPPELGTPFLGINVPRSLFPRRRKRKPKPVVLSPEALRLLDALLVALEKRADGNGGEANGHANTWDEVLP